MNPELLRRARQKGTDAEFQAWVRKWPSCLSGAYSEIVNGEGRSVYAHVRSVEHGAGTAIKPPYSGIPMRQEEHLIEDRLAPLWWRKQQAEEYLCRWVMGVRPPEMEEQKAHWKQEYIIEHPGHMLALKMLLDKHFAKDKAPPVKCTLQRHVRRRSNKQNAAQWSVPLYESVISFLQERPDVLANEIERAIILCANRDYYGSRDEFKNLVHWLMKQLFNGGKSTAKLSTIQSAEYAERIREYFLLKHTHQITPPISEGNYE